MRIKVSVSKTVHDNDGHTTVTFGIDEEVPVKDWEQAMSDYSLDLEELILEYFSEDENGTGNDRSLSNSDYDDDILF